MKKILTMLMFSLLTFTSVFAQNTANLFIENATVNGSQTKFSFEIHITPTNDWGSNTGDKALVNCSWYFNYNSAALENPVITFVGSPVNATHYDNTTGSTGGQLFVDTKIHSFDPGVPLTQSTKYHVYTVELDITISSLESDLTWDQINTGILSATSKSVNENYDGTGDIPLPVELSSFMATVNQGLINLIWQTITEVNNYGFEVERKIGGSELGAWSWEKIGFVPGYGNSISPKDYSFVDKSPEGGSRFIYRLKQIDYDGKFSYSDQVEIELLPDNFALYQNYPNPFNPVTIIKFAVPKAGNINLSVYNILGEKIKDLAVGFYEPGIYNVSFDGKEFTSGTYIYRMQAESTTGGFVQIKKMLLVR